MYPSIAWRCVYVRVMIEDRKSNWYLLRYNTIDDYVAHVHVSKVGEVLGVQMSKAYTCK